MISLNSDSKMLKMSLYLVLYFTLARQFRLTYPETRSQSTKLKSTYTTCEGVSLTKLKAPARGTRVCQNSLQGWRHWQAPILHFPCTLLALLVPALHSPATAILPSWPKTQEKIMFNITNH